MPNALSRDVLWGASAADFARQALGFTPDPWQEAALSTTARRGIWLCSRQTGKSTTAAVLGLHTALYRQDALVLLASPSLRQSAELYRKVQTLMGSMDRTPALTEDTKTSCEFTLTGSRIVCLPGTEATIRGYSGVSLLIEDEASRVSDSFHFAVRPMLAVGGGRHVQLSTPFGRRGHFYDTWSLQRPGWQRLSVTADECPRISREFLDAELIEVGEWWFRQEYENCFNDLLDSYFTSSVIESAFTDDVSPLFEQLDEIAGFGSFITSGGTT